MALFKRRENIVAKVVKVGDVLLTPHGAYRVDYSCITQLPVVRIGKEGPDGK